MQEGGSSILHFWTQILNVENEAVLLMRSHSQQEVSLESTSGQKVKALFYSKNIILRPFTSYAHAHEQAPTRTHASACTYLHSPHIYDYEIEVITERFHFVGRWIHLS